MAVGFAVNLIWINEQGNDQNQHIPPRHEKCGGNPMEEWQSSRSWCKAPRTACQQVALAEIQEVVLRSRCPKRAFLPSGRAKKSVNGSMPLRYQNNQNELLGVKSCKAIVDDKERLKCFDGLFGETSKPEESREERQANWSIEETKSSTDGSPQVVAANLVGDTVLILRCKGQTTEAAFSTQYNYLGYKSVDVQLRINDQNPIKEIWKASVNGRAAFAPDAVAFIQSLPDNGELSVKTTRSNDRKIKEATFNLGAVSKVRNKIAKACD
jgi:hypothetical protein